MEENKIITGVSTDDSVIAALNEQGADLTKKSTPYSLLEAIRISNQEASYKSTNETVVEAANAESPVDYDIILVAEDYSGTNVHDALESIAYEVYENALESFVTKQVEEQTVKLESANILATGTSYYLDNVDLRVDLGSDGNYAVGIGSVGMVQVTEIPRPGEVIPWTATTISDTVIFDDSITLNMNSELNQVFVEELGSNTADFELSDVTTGNEVGSVEFVSDSLASGSLEVKFKYGDANTPSSTDGVWFDLSVALTYQSDPSAAEVNITGAYGDAEGTHTFPTDLGFLSLTLPHGPIMFGTGSSAEHATAFAAQLLKTISLS